MAYTESNKTEKEIVHEIKDVRETSDSSRIIKNETTQPDLSTEELAQQIKGSDADRDQPPLLTEEIAQQIKDSDADRDKPPLSTEELAQQIKASDADSDQSIGQAKSK